MAVCLFKVFDSGCEFTHLKECNTEGLFVLPCFIYMYISVFVDVLKYSPCCFSSVLSRLLSFHWRWSCSISSHQVIPSSRPVRIPRTFWQEPFCSFFFFLTGRWLTAHSEDPAEELTGRARVRDEEKWARGLSEAQRTERGRTPNDRKLLTRLQALRKLPQLHLLPLVPVLLKTWIIHLALSQLCFFLSPQSGRESSASRACRLTWGPHSSRPHVFNRAHTSSISTQLIIGSATTRSEFQKPVIWIWKTTIRACCIIAGLMLDRMRGRGGGVSLVLFHAAFSLLHACHYAQPAAILLKIIHTHL